MRNNKLPSYRIFNLITLVIDKFNLKGMTKYLCSIFGFSRSGYYNYKSNLSVKNHIEKQDLKAKKLVLRAFNFRGYRNVWPKPLKNIG